MPDTSSFILFQSFILTESDVTESIYFNVAMGWQVPFIVVTTSKYINAKKASFEEK